MNTLWLREKIRERYSRDRNQWWKDIAGALMIGVLCFLFMGCGARPYVEVGVNAEIREPVMGRVPCYLAVGAQRDFKDGALSVDCAVRHYSGCFIEDDVVELNMPGCQFRAYPRELRKDR